MSKKVHGEIEYFLNGDKNNTGVHSDICPPECEFKNITPEYREYLHSSLDEWLNESNGTGCFYIKEEGYRCFSCEQGEVP